MKYFKDVILIKIPKTLFFSCPEQIQIKLTARPGGHNATI